MRRSPPSQSTSRRRAFRFWSLARLGHVRRRVVIENYLFLTSAAFLFVGICGAEFRAMPLFTDLRFERTGG
jgi:hypothetical protein